eukprot:CAMPEP_0196576664 /NCGR_PEP_ID=MMETSP1081-20130531/5876_1 /TAXON_ID=36882 /ORGANISM="Pyramimonas amylifera, Strain CCMP720" /LENGTH=55 /DNA_ID=CAMNT_0041895341 /DNA_START=22 /DNA_END=186 /DNA_ORIENTATION=+
MAAGLVIFEVATFPFRCHDFKHAFYFSPSTLRQAQRAVLSKVLLPARPDLQGVCG